MRADRWFWDTDIGGDAWKFPSTVWSRIVPAPDGPEVEQALETLACLYWKPVYCHIRSRHASSNEEAKDRTQDFFLWMMEKEFLSRADPSRGRFRAFLKTALDHYLSNQLRAARAMRRGGDRQVFAIEALPEELEAEMADPRVRAPGDVLDEVWRRELLERAIDRVETEMTKDGKSAWFDLFREYFLEEGESNYDALAARYKISFDDVGNRLMHTKRRFRDALLQEVAETVGGMEDLRAELAWLFRKDRA